MWGFNFPVWPFFVVLGLLFAAGFGAGYGCAGCDYRPHVELRRVSR